MEAVQDRINRLIPTFRDSENPDELSELGNELGSCNKTANVDIPEAITTSFIKCKNAFLAIFEEKRKDQSTCLDFSEIDEIFRKRDEEKPIA